MINLILKKLKYNKKLTEVVFSGLHKNYVSFCSTELLNWKFKNLF
jgi:hypothetical protein